MRLNSGIDQDQSLDFNLPQSKINPEPTHHPLDQHIMLALLRPSRAMPKVCFSRSAYVLRV